MKALGVHIANATPYRPGSTWRRRIGDLAMGAVVGIVMALLALAWMGAR
jgi:hypothetical protein